MGIYRGYMGIMEKKMEATWGYIGLYRDNEGLYGDNGQENGSYLELYRVI